MRNKDKTKQQLLDEIALLHQTITQLERSEVERSRAEAALRESEEKYRNLVESTLDIIFIVKRRNVKDEFEMAGRVPEETQVG